MSSASSSLSAAEAGCALPSVPPREVINDAYLPFTTPNRPEDSAVLSLAAAFCNKYHGHSILFVGDSISGQMFTSFVHLLGAHSVEDRERNASCRRYGHAGGAHEVHIDAQVCARFCRRATARFIRNEYLSLEPPSQLALRRRYGLLMCDWSDAARVSDVLELNRGMHAAPTKQFSLGLKATLRRRPLTPLTGAPPWLSHGPFKYGDDCFTNASSMRTFYF